jgi:hypothetical protein
MQLIENNYRNKIRPYNNMINTILFNSLEFENRLALTSFFSRVCETVGFVRWTVSLHCSYLESMYCVYIPRHQFTFLQPQLYFWCFFQ